MLIDLTVNVAQDSPLIQWAKSQDSPHIAMGHIGTHLDIYEKTKIPLEYFKSRGIIFDVRNINEISINDIDINEIKEGDFVIFRTGSMEKYSYGEPSYFNNHLELSKELIEELVKHNIHFIGIDSPGIRRHKEHEQADRFCEKNGVYIIENLDNLEKIEMKNFTVYTMWLDDEIMTGLKCKIIVEY